MLSPSLYEICDPCFRAKLLPGVAMEELHHSCRWAEGPVWFGDRGCLLWSDIPNQRVMQWMPGAGVSVYRAASNFANGNTRDRQGRLVTCEHGTRRVTRTEVDGTITVLADSFGGRRLNSPNDVVVKSDGAIYFTDPPYGVQPARPGTVRPVGWWTQPIEGKEQPCQGVYRITADGALHLLVDDFALPNGLAFSPDGRDLYVNYTDTQGHTHVTEFAFDDDGADPGSRRDVLVVEQPFSNHNGGLVLFGPDGLMYVGLGDGGGGGDPDRNGLDLSTLLGKILRIDPREAGQEPYTVPPSNPFTDREGARPEIYSYGHRNLQGLTVHPETGALWETEHGPQGGDELNLIEKGRNYGWPVQAYGVEYSGRPIAGASPAPPNFEQPRYYWDPVIAPSGAQFYSGTAFPAWRNNLFVGSLKERLLVRLTLDGNRVSGEERLLADRGQRVRDVRQGPDGALYIVTDENNGELWKVLPKR